MKLILTASILALTCAGPALAAEPFRAGDFMIRGRAVGVLPNEDADISGAVTGNSIKIDNSYVPELDFSYFVTDNIAFELIAAVAPHHVGTAASSAGPLDLGDVWLLPPTLMVQYHFSDLGVWKPYLGAGINYTHFFNEDAGSSVTSAEYDDSVGLALQAGVDYAIDDHWQMNLDVKKIWINTDVAFSNGTIAADVDINPLLVGMGVGYRF